MRHSYGDGLACETAAPIRAGDPYRVDASRAARRTLRPQADVVRVDDYPIRGEIFALPALRLVAGHFEPANDRRAWADFLVGDGHIDQPVIRRPEHLWADFNADNLQWRFRRGIQQNRYLSVAHRGEGQIRPAIVIEIF